MKEKLGIPILHNIKNQFQIEEKNISEDGKLAFDNQFELRKFAEKLNEGKDIIYNNSKAATSGELNAVLIITGVMQNIIEKFTNNAKHQIMKDAYKFFFWGQPIAHSNHVWNFGGMVLAGLAFAMAGGCPGRQLFMSGEGDGDAAVFVLGMIAGAAIAHNFAMASSSKGPGFWGPASVIIGLIVCITMGFTMRENV